MPIKFIQVCLYFCISLNLDRDLLSSLSLYLIIFPFWAMFDNLMCAGGTDTKKKKKCFLSFEHEKGPLFFCFPVVLLNCFPTCEYFHFQALNNSNYFYLHIDNKVCNRKKKHESTNKSCCRLFLKNLLYPSFKM